MYIVVAGFCGLLFGLGLIVSAMVDPAKVLGFLNITGLWDPSLGLVMGGAIAVALPGFTYIKKRQNTGQKALLGSPLVLPSKRSIDAPLILGSLIFGAGWGLAGLCPGPAVVSLGAGSAQAGYFVLAMLFGMVGYHFFLERKNG